MGTHGAQVARGFRPSINEQVPSALRRLIQRCWAQKAKDRPDAATVAAELRQLIDNKALARWDRMQGGRRKGGGDGGGCCVIS